MDPKLAQLDRRNSSRNYTTVEFGISTVIAAGEHRSAAGFHRTSNSGPASG